MSKKVEGKFRTKMANLGRFRKKRPCKSTRIKSHVEVGRNIKIAMEKTLKINTFRDLICEHKYIETTENFYISSTDENKKDVSNVFDSLMSSETISNIIKYEIAY